jgi:hypothetical protein
MKLILKVDDKKAAALIEWLQTFEFVRIISSQGSDDPSLSVEEKKLIDQRMVLYSSKHDQLFDWDEVKHEFGQK